MPKIIKLPSLSFRCECAPKKLNKKCGKLLVVDFGDGDIEIDGVYLKQKSITKLIGFLSKSILLK